MDLSFLTKSFRFFLAAYLCFFSLVSMSEDDSCFTLNKLATYRYLDRNYENFLHIGYLNKIMHKHRDDPNISIFFEQHKNVLSLFSGDFFYHKESDFQLFIPGEVMLLIELADIDYVEKCLELINQLNVTDEKKRLPIHYLSIRQNDDVCELGQWMLKNGANIDQQDHSGKTPLHWAILKKNYLVSAYLLSEKAALNRKDNKGNTPLHYAVKNNCFNLVLLLLDYKAKFNIKNKDGLDSYELSLDLDDDCIHREFSHLLSFSNQNKTPRKKSARHKKSVHHRKKKKISTNQLSSREHYKIKNNHGKSKSSANLHNRLKKRSIIQKNLLQKMLDCSKRLVVSSKI